MVKRIILSAALLLSLAAAVIKPVEVAGESMEPVLHNGEIRLCLKGAPFRRGDVICVRFGGRLLIKRVGAVCGEQTPIGRVPKGTVYLTGDNAEVSIDSRNGLGFVPLMGYVGKVIMLFR